jgi:quercetin dioxygenase-like cupin family protein
MQLTDGQVRFTRGGFAHVARNNADSVFRNVSIDFLRHQGALHNLCQKITDGPVNDCPDPPASETHSVKPLFETEEITVLSGALAAKAKHTEEAPKTAALIVAMNNSEITVKVAKGAESQLKAGQVAWLPAGQSHTISAGSAAARFLLVSFKDATH